MLDRTKIAGFPMGTLPDRKPLFDGDADRINTDPRLDQQFFTKAPLFPNELTRIKPGARPDLVALKDAGTMVPVGYRLMSHEMFGPKQEPPKETIFLLSGGPALFSDYMKKRVKVLLQSGHDVVLMDQRGTRDNKPSTLAAVAQGTGAQAGSTMPLADEDNSTDPLTMAEVANHNNVASDLDAVMNDVLSKGPREMIIIGHSAGGELLNHYLGFVGQGRATNVPKSVGYSGSNPLSANFQVNWARGQLDQAVILKRMYELVPDLKVAVDTLFNDVANAELPAGEDPRIRAVTARRLHDAYGFSVEGVGDEAIKAAAETYLADVQGHQQLLQDQGVKGLLDAVNADSMYINNKLYTVLCPMTIGNGFGDAENGALLEQMAEIAGVDIGDPSDAGMMRYLSGANDTQLDPNRRAFEKQVANLIDAGKLEDSKPADETIFEGMKKIGRVVAFNGQADAAAPAGFALGSTAEVLKDLGYDLSKLGAVGEEGLKVVMMTADGNHGSLFSKGAPHLTAMLDTLRGGAGFGTGAEIVENNPFAQTDADVIQREVDLNDKIEGVATQAVVEHVHRPSFEM